MSRNGVRVLRARNLVFPPATIRSGAFSRMTASSPLVEVSSMILASWCINAFIRWKSSRVEFCVPAARISTPSSRSALTIDQVPHHRRAAAPCPHCCVQRLRDVAERLRRVGHPVEGLLQVADPPALLHLAREVGQALGADDDVELRAVGPAQLLE